jgi:tryptophan-rich sensory protein
MTEPTPPTPPNPSTPPTPSTEKSETDWYKGLKKSPLTPPSGVIPIVWAILYVLIIASGVIYIKNGGYINSAGFLYYFGAWILNLSWSPLFFTYHRPDLSFFVIIFLMLLIAYTIYEFNKVSQLASYLLIPYLLWVVFATSLNAYIVRCNKDKDSNRQLGEILSLFKQGRSFC